jgi:hypothetical protein
MWLPMNPINPIIPKFIILVAPFIAFYRISLSFGSMILISKKPNISLKCD